MKLPEEFDGKVSEGNKLFQEGHFIGAAAKYREAIEMAGGGEKLTPRPSKVPSLGLAKAYSNLAAAEASQGNWEESRKAALQATETDPTFLKGWSRLGQSLRSLNRFEEAVTAYERLKGEELSSGVAAVETEKTIQELKGLMAAGHGIASKQTHDSFYYQKSIEKGTEALKKDSLLEAIRHYTKAIDLCPPDASRRERATLYANRSTAYYKNGNYLEALADGESSIVDDPSYARGHARLGVAALHLGHCEQARNALEKALTLDPANALALEHIAEARSRFAASEEEKRVQKQTAEKKLQEETEAIERARKEKADALKAEKEAILQKNPELHLMKGFRGVGGYRYCRHCNQYGHSVDDCPMRKRPRQP
jgi:tetratricopeptide (TPR) repeat protein